MTEYDIKFDDTGEILKICLDKKLYTSIGWLFPIKNKYGIIQYAMNDKFQVYNDELKLVATLNVPENKKSLFITDTPTSNINLATHQAPQKEIKNEARIKNIQDERMRGVLNYNKGLHYFLVNFSPYVPQEEEIVIKVFELIENGNNNYEYITSGVLTEIMYLLKKIGEGSLAYNNLDLYLDTKMLMECVIKFAEEKHKVNKIKSIINKAATAMNTFLSRGYFNTLFLDRSQENNKYNCYYSISELEENVDISYLSEEELAMFEARKETLISEETDRESTPDAKSLLRKVYDVYDVGTHEIGYEDIWLIN